MWWRDPYLMMHAITALAKTLIVMFVLGLAIILVSMMIHSGYRVFWCG